MHKQATIKSFFEDVSKGNYKKLPQYFTVDGVIHSPLYGSLKAAHFYKKLGADTQKMKVTIKDQFFSAENPTRAAVHISLHWTTKKGIAVQVECVDIFEFVSDGDKIKSLTIIYDTYHAREKMQKRKAPSTRKKIQKPKAKSKPRKTAKSKKRVSAKTRKTPRRKVK